MGWILILIGGICEIFWVSGLKHADTIWLYCLTGIGILFSFCCMIIAVKRVEVSIAYAVFVGIGTAGVVIAEMTIFGEEVSLLKVSLIAVLLIGVVGLKLVSKEDDKQIAEGLSLELGLDEILEDRPHQDTQES